MLLKLSIGHWALLCPCKIKHFLTVWYQKQLQAQVYILRFPWLVFLIISPGIGFPRNLGAFYWKMIFRNQYLDVRCAYCYWGVTGCSYSQRIEVGNTCLYTNSCTCYLLYCNTTYCIYILKRDWVDTPSSVHVAFSLSLICDSSLMMSSLALIIYTVHLLIYSSLVYK